MRFQAWFKAVRAGMGWLGQFQVSLEDFGQIGDRFKKFRAV